MDQTKNIDSNNDTISVGVFEDILVMMNSLPKDTKQAVLGLIDILSTHLSPKLLNLKNQLNELKDVSSHIYGNGYDILSICDSQISKSTNLMVEIFKKEIQNVCIMVESRHLAFERIAWCLEKLKDLEVQITSNKMFENCVDNSDPSNSSHKIKKVVHKTNKKNDIDICAGDDFISWVDDALDLLDTFSNLFDENNYSRKNQHSDLEKYETWKYECASRLLSLHGVVRELVFAAMNICQNCLQLDQKIINARCHVVLRESRNFISEIMVETKFSIDDCDASNLKKIVLKKDIHYPTVKLFNDILKNAVYNLEASINRAVLGLVLLCLVEPAHPLQLLMTNETNCTPAANLKNTKDVASVEDDNALFTEEDTTLVKEFDIHNERLVQIGLFAISCSADKMRVLMLKSCLASLEALDPYLVPTVLSTPDSPHAQILTEHWIKEINCLRTLVYLIVDPAAYIEIVVEQYQCKLNFLKVENSLPWSAAQYFIGLGQSVLDYIKAYTDNEPKAFQQMEKIILVIDDLKKVVKECKAASDLFLIKQNTNIHENDDSKCKMASKKTTTEQQIKEGRVLKRLKLLFTILSKISKDLSEETSTLDSLVEDSVCSDDCNKEILVNATWTKPNKVEIIYQPQKCKGFLKIFDKFKLTLKKSLPSEVISNDVKIQDGKNNIVDDSNTLNRTSFARIISKKRRNISSTYTCPSPIYPTRSLEVYSSTARPKPIHNLFSASDFCLDQNSEEYALANISAQNPLTLEIDDLNLSGFKFESMCSPSQNQFEKKSLFYGNHSKNSRRRRASLRKRLLLNRTDARKINVPPSIGTPRRLKTKLVLGTPPKYSESFNTSLDLQITDILEQLTGLSDTMSLIRIDNPNDKHDDYKTAAQMGVAASIKDITNIKNNVLTLKINEEDNDTKNVWNIRVTSDKENFSHSPAVNRNSSTRTIFESPKTNGVECEIDVSFGSNVPTPERLNDINQLEQKLSELRKFWKS